MAAKAARARVTPPVSAGWFASALFALCALGLFASYGQIIQNEAVDAVAISMGVAAVFAAIGALLNGFSLRPSRLMAASAVFLGWALVSAMASERGWTALMGEPSNLLGWLTLVAVAAIAVGAASDPVRVRRVLAVYGPWLLLAQTITVYAQLITGYEGHGTLPNSTYLGECLLLLTPWLLSDDEGVGDWDRRSRFILGALVVGALAASGARIAALFGAAWLIWSLVRRSEVTVKVKRLSVAGIVLVVLGAAFTFARSELLGSFGVGVLGERPGMWAAALRAVAARPVLGFGPDGFVAGGALVTTPELAAKTSTLVFRMGAVDPHDLLIWVTVSMGFVGLALFAWLVAEIIVRWRARARAGWETGPAVWALCGATVVFLTAPAAINALPLFALILGVSVSVPADGAPKAWQLRAGAAVAVMFALVSLVFALNAASRLAVERFDATRSPKIAVRSQWLSDLWPFDAHLAYLTSMHWGYVVNADPSVAVTQPDLVAITRAVELDRRNPFYALEHARTVSFYGAPDAQVEAAYAQAFARWPLYPLARAEYAIWLVARGRMDEAREQMAIADLANLPDSETRAGMDAARKALAEAGIK